MRLNKNIIFPGILIYGLIVVLLTLFDVQFLCLRPICSFIFLMTIPGLLIVLMLRIRKINFWEYLVYIIGLSITFLMFAGLLINWALPWLGIDKPLSLIPLLVSLGILLFIFWIIAYIRNKEISIEIKIAKPDWLNIFFFIIPIILLVFSIFGALVLNSNGPDTFTMITLGGIAVYVLVLIFFRDELNKNVYPWAILLISLAMLLSTSLRSWNISGHDIITEYQMFQLTKENLYWSMSYFPGHAYNACLSITIFPTVLSSFFKINDIYIFKIFFQIIFSFISVVVYLFLKRYTKTTLAFIAVLFFISLPTFFIDLPMMTRQEISLFFFALMLLILFKKQINLTVKISFFIIFGFSMIISHYSTSYVALAFFLGTYILTFLFRKWENRKINRRIPSHVKKQKYFLSGYLIIALLVFGFVWYSSITHTTNGLIDFINKSSSNLENIFSDDVRAGQTSVFEQFNIFSKPKDQTVLVQDYIKETELNYKNMPYINYYPQEKYENYNPQLIPDELVPLKINSNIASKIYYFEEIIKKLVKVFIVIGVFYPLFNLSKKRVIDTEYIFMILISLFLLLAIMILPLASIEYNLLRTYQQVLIILSLPAVLGCSIIFKFLKKENIKVILISFIFIIYFLFCCGFISQIIGDSEASINLNNFGIYYDKYYTHDSEVKSAQWLSNNYDKKDLICVDDSTSSKLKTFSNIKDGQFFYYIIPSIMDKDSYVYLSYTNTIKKIIIQSYRGRIIEYNFPTQFLNDNKNKIYNNGGSEIFK